MVLPLPISQVILRSFITTDYNYSSARTR